MPDSNVLSPTYDASTNKFHQEQTKPGFLEETNVNEDKSPEGTKLSTPKKINFRKVKE